ncbi:M23 family peptidase [Enterobacter mori]|uniref:M23 family peptidase n=1 Tax=Enterobacter mori TaxID=539813 RepID=UPI0028ACB1A7|nr:M23 family peptidase [Enterobacter mori]HED2471117.1 M23 family peptidase [Enterobacter mori]
MIISPPFIREQNAGGSDYTWVSNMLPIDARRSFPLNTHGSWHGGVHVTHTDATSHPEMLRAIADGMVVSFRKPSALEKRDAFPLNYNGKTDDGYVLLKHETAIGSGDSGSIVFYSLYMHLRERLAPAIVEGAKIWRKDVIGQSGMVDGANAFHLQVFCDDENMMKLTGRTTPGLNIATDGRTDTVYGDIHFYLPSGTPFYEQVANAGSPDTGNLNKVHTSTAPLFVSMTFENGSCTMVTRSKNASSVFVYDTVGDPLVDTDSKKNKDGKPVGYEYSLYHTACRLYPQNPSAGFELLRFGRVINTEHETLTPANAPLWRTVSFPGGKGMVNLASPDIKKFSDADFPHWTGWWMVDDDMDNNSQCNSPLIADLQKSGHLSVLSSKLVCHFPLEWNAATFDQRYDWLKKGSEDVPVMSDTDYSKIKEHASALRFDTGALGTGRLWHFHPAAFISHFRKCCWLSTSELKQLVPLNALNEITWSPVHFDDSKGSVPDNIHLSLNKMMQKYLVTTPLRMSCFFGNAIQETKWLSTTYEGYRYTDRDPRTKTVIGHHNIWYYPWHGRGLLQITNPHNYFNYFSFKGRTYPENVKSSISLEYERLYKHRNLRYSDNHLSDAENSNLPANVIEWRGNVESPDYEATDSAGFYWISREMAKYSDSPHVLERCSIRTNRGVKVYYRSHSFWNASAAVNLPSQVGKTGYSGINAFDTRCCVYGNAISVLTEMKFPDSNQQLTIEKPESNQLRRDK